MNGWKWAILAWGVFLPLVVLFSLEYWLDKRMTRVEDTLRSEDKSLRSEMQGEEQALRGEIVRGFDMIEARLNNTGQPEAKKGDRAVGDVRSALRSAEVNALRQRRLSPR